MSAECIYTVLQMHHLNYYWTAQGIKPVTCHTVCKWKSIPVLTSWGGVYPTDPVETPTSRCRTPSPGCRLNWFQTPPPWCRSPITWIQKISPWLQTLLVMWPVINAVKPTPSRQSNTCEHITLPQTLFASCNQLIATSKYVHFCSH